jgi:lipopolysaccharide/colanic/teichoic acid biosynthesis glycosyltransferase
VEFYGPREFARLSVTPGLTGLWQVSGRCNLNFQEMIELDLTYIANWSLWLDLLILLKTPWAVVSGKGAY